jgi:hypothetical protein
MSEHVKEHGPTERRYESSEISVSKLFFSALSVVALVLAGVVGSALAFRFFVRHTPMGPPASPFEDVRQMPPGLRLQTDAPLDLKNYRDGQNKLLSGYGWVDKQSGVVRIPVDRAMQLLLQKGYPVRGSSPANGQAVTPGEEPPPPNRQLAPVPYDGSETRP